MHSCDKSRQRLELCVRHHVTSAAATYRVKNHRYHAAHRSDDKGYAASSVICHTHKCARRLPELSIMSAERNRTEKLPLSGKVVVSDRSADPRVRRTRDRLGDALVEILLQKPLADINVQEILDRAGVSRSTFYSHFRDTNDLFLSDVDDFFEAMATALSRAGSKSKRVAPVANCSRTSARAAPSTARWWNPGASRT